MKKTGAALMVLVVLATAPRLLAQISETNSFTGLNKAIPDGNPSGVADFRTISSGIVSISSVKVKLNISGNFNGDLYGYLSHSSGFTVLLNRPGKTAASPGGYDDSGFDVTIQDGAPNGDLHTYRAVSTPGAGLPLTGIWEPDARNIDPADVLNTSSRTAYLSAFNGLSAGGDWTLFVADLESGGTNRLNSWELRITGQAQPVIVWSNPGSVSYGTALGAGQLNATAGVPGAFAYSPASGTVLNAGTGQSLQVIFTPTDLVSYRKVTNTVSIDVSKAPLTITAADKSKVYGAALPALTAAYSGFVNGDTSASLDTPVSLSTTATPGSPVGPYPITASVAADANYAVTFASGTLTVDRAPLTITAADKSKVYGAALPELTAAYSGFVNGDTSASLDTPVSLSTTATPGSPVGPYPITASVAADANYAVTFASGTLTVDRAPLTITAADKSKVYGAALPELTAAYSGFVNGDTSASLDTPVSLSTTATPGSPVGPYPITASVAADANYAVTFASGTLTVDRAPLTITAADKSKVYGAALPELTAAYSGFVNGDTSASLDTPVSLSTTAATGSPAGTYPITASAATDGNYTIAFVSGTLTVNRAGTTGVVGSSANPVPPGAPVSFTFALSAVAPGAGTPSGSVQFKVDDAVVGSPAPVVGGTAGYSTASLLAATHSVTAEYAGDANFTGTTNSLVPLLVVNTPPVATPDAIKRYPDQGAKALLSVLLGNDTDADGDTVVFDTLAPTSTAGGTVSLQGAWVHYTPPAGYTNVDAFTYVVKDGHGGTATGTVTVEINPDDGQSQSLTVLDLGGGSFRIRFFGIPGRTYTLEYTESLVVPNWQTVTSGMVNELGYQDVIETPPAGSPARYYRTVYPVP